MLLRAVAAVRQPRSAVERFGQLTRARRTGPAAILRSAHALPLVPVVARPVPDSFPSLGD